MTPRLAAATSRQLKKATRQDGSFDLRDTRQHGVIEHDRSFTRQDFRHGDNHTLQPDMFEAMLDDADGGPVTVKTLAETYKRRRREHKESGGEPLPLGMWIVNLAQSVSFLNATRTDGELSREMMMTFYLEERFPDEVLNNKTPRTMLGLAGCIIKFLFYIIT